jgi:hypothetical protein
MACSGTALLFTNSISNFVMHACKHPTTTQSTNFRIVENMSVLRFFFTQEIFELAMTQSFGHDEINGFWKQYNNIRYFEWFRTQIFKQWNIKLWPVVLFTSLVISEYPEMFLTAMAVTSPYRDVQTLQYLLDINVHPIVALLLTLR